MGFSEKIYEEKLSLLERLLSKGKWDDIYEISQLLFKNTNDPLFFYICIKCTLDGQRNNDVEWLLELCKNEALREFLRGIYLTLNKHWIGAQASFRSSIKYGKSKNKYLLYHVFLEKNKVVLRLNKATINSCGRANISNLIEAEKKRVNKIICEWPEIIPENFIDVGDKSSIPPTSDTSPKPEHKFFIHELVEEFRKELAIVIKKELSAENNIKPDSINVNNDEETSSKKRPAIPLETIKAIKPLLLPEDISIKDLSVKWSDESCVFHLLNANYRNWQEVRTYKEMGFESLRPKGRPIKEWNSILGRLAENNGRIHVEKNDKYLPQEVNKANGRLDLFIDIGENHIIIDEIDKKHPFYYCQFKILKLAF